MSTTNNNNNKLTGSHWLGIALAALPIVRAIADAAGLSFELPTAEDISAAVTSILSLFGIKILVNAPRATFINKKK